MSMVADQNARLTHATYTPGEFKTDNSGTHALPNGRDMKAIKDLPKLGYFVDYAFFGSRDGKVHVTVKDSMTHAVHKFMQGRGYEHSKTLIDYDYTDDTALVFW